MNGLEDLVDQKLNLAESCKVCGDNNFELREGFYYCNECGTKQDLIQAVFVEQNENFCDGPILQKRTKIQNDKEKAEEFEITSWECYNYVLRGVVEELISIGAKEELKLMTLQLWAAFLRKNQVAFFNKRHADLPKLGVGFLKRDARVLYNHCLKKRANRRKTKSEGGSILTSEASSRRRLRKSKRQLDQSIYSQSSVTNVSTSETCLSSSTSGASNRPIQLKFSSRARKILKKAMPAKHLKKHENDALGVLTCHSFTRSNCQTTVHDYFYSAMNLRQLIALLGTALNLIEDDIQLSDLLRFVNEGHITRRNVLKYFPEDAFKVGDRILKEILFNITNKETYENKLVREQISCLSKFVQIRSFKVPNILKLVERYLLELGLPKDIYIYVERLVNLLPPTFKTRVPHLYPNFEARAMAYIIFILKLFLGLDGYKEDLISSSSNNINNILGSAGNSDTELNGKSHPKLFVWKDWVKYVEMRKVIIAQYSRTFTRQFKQRQTIDNCLKELIVVQKNQSEEEKIQGKIKKTAGKVENMQRIFEELSSTLGTGSTKLEVDSISFEPTLTPAHTYFKKLLLLHNMKGSNSFPIPDYMLIDHSQRTLEPHLNTQRLVEFLKHKNIDLDIKLVSCSPERNFIGYFWNMEESNAQPIRIFRADFNVNTEEWSKEIRSRPLDDSITFKTELEPYKKRYLKEQQKKLNLRMRAAQRLREREEDGAGMDNGMEDDIRSLPSIDVFREDNMDVLENVKLDAPIRNLNSVNVLESTTLDENLKPTNENLDCFELDKKIEAEAEKSSDIKSLTFATSKMDYWLLLGIASRVTVNQKKMLHQKFPRSFAWLIDTCAQTLGDHWFSIYEQLVAIEVMFSQGIENLDTFKDCLRFRYDFDLKEIASLAKAARDIW